jgi:hypothetical protein
LFIEEFAAPIQVFLTESHQQITKSRDPQERTPVAGFPAFPPLSNLFPQEPVAKFLFAGIARPLDIEQFRSYI